MAQPRDPILRGPAHRAAWDHRLGTSALQVRQHDRRCQGKTAIRPVLYQECFSWPRCIDHVPDRENCAPRPGGAMRWVFWISVLLVGYAYLGYPIWLWLRSQLWPKPVMRGT